MKTRFAKFNRGGHHRASNFSIADAEANLGHFCKSSKSLHHRSLTVFYKYMKNHLWNILPK